MLTFVLGSAIVTSLAVTVASWFSANQCKVVTVPAILVVEDNPDNRETLAVVVTTMGYEVVTAESGEAALRALEQRADIALVVCDIRLPGMDGMAFREVVRERYPALKIALVTGDPDAADAAVQAGVVAMLKPYKFDALTRVIVEALASA